MKDHPLYPRQDAQALGRYYLSHVAGMTEADLDSKGDICEQLAWRDKRIAELEAENARLLLATPGGQAKLREQILDHCFLGCPHPMSEHKDGFCSKCECGGYLDPGASFDPKRCAAHPWFIPEQGQPCCFCEDTAKSEPDATKLARVHHDAECYQAGWAAAMARSEGEALAVKATPPKCERKGTGTTVGPGGFRLCDACYSPREQRQLAPRYCLKCRVAISRGACAAHPDLDLVAELPPLEAPKSTPVLHCHGCTDDMCPGCCDCVEAP